MFWLIGVINEDFFLVVGRRNRDVFFILRVIWYGRRKVCELG